LPHLVGMNTIVESRMFTRKVSQIWNDVELEAFKEFIAQKPLAGSVIPGTGGVRKVRWGRTGSGKRNGVRVIYFIRSPHETWLLTLYAKNEIEDIPAHELKKVREKIDG